MKKKVLSIFAGSLIVGCRVASSSLSSPSSSRCCRRHRRLRHRRQLWLHLEPATVAMYRRRRLAAASFIFEVGKSFANRAAAATTIAAQQQQQLSQYSSN